jgi:hypothetical protein
MTTRQSEGKLGLNNWKENANGESYLELIRAGRPDLLARAAELRARVKTVNREFADRYGWGAADEGARFSPARSERDVQPGSPEVRGGVQGQPDAAVAERVGGSAEPGAGESQPGVPGRPTYGEPRPNSISAVGVHFSAQQRSALNGAYYGKGLPGARME